MDNIAIFDTSQGTQNLGDYIIMDSINREMDFLFSKNFVTRYPTHTPIARSYQNLRKGMILRVLDNAKYKFIGGTNIFKNSLLTVNPDWNVNVFNIRFYKDSIAIGCGSALNKDKMDAYTKFFYTHILRKDIIHSTRDERTKKMLEALGFQAINTGCATMWGLSEEHCAEIPTNKSDNVVFTLTDYKVERSLDQKLIDILISNYKNVYYWPQGAEDYGYFKTLSKIDGIKIVPSNLKSYNDILSGNIDYIGTRLHAGIYALQHQKRSIILSVDERAKDMDETYNLNCIDRAEIISKLEDRIQSSFGTQIKIDTERINQWKDQFR